MADEIWKPIPGYVGYEASSLGRVRSITRDIPFLNPRYGAAVQRCYGRILRQRIVGKGYLQIAGSIYGRPFGLRVNRAVALAFHGPPPSNLHEAAHYNGDSLDNSSINVRWATKLENEEDKDRHGRRPRGIANGSAKVTPEAVVEIRRRCAGGETKTAIAADYGITRQAVRAIVQREHWAHVP
jgi:hypothetical protein